MSWIESHQKLEKSGKLIGLRKQLDINRCQAIGHLHCLWWWAVDNAEDGDVTRYSPAVIEEACGWTEYVLEQEELTRVADVNVPEREAMFNALIEFGFIDVTKGKRYIHDWAQYTARYFEGKSRYEHQRQLTRERVKRHREKSRAVTQGEALQERNVTACNAPTIPDLTIPDLKEQKKRRQRRLGETDANSASSPPAIIPVPAPLLDLPEYAKDQKLCLGLPAAILAWEKAYPGVNITAEIRRAYAWEMADPRRKKVLRLKFLQSWMARTQDHPKTGGRTDAPNGGQSVPVSAIELTRAREAEEIRKRQHARREIYARVGDLPDVHVKT